jgi:hypothetical protein
MQCPSPKNCIGYEFSSSAHAQIMSNIQIIYTGN